MEEKLYRSRRNRVVSGVCAGLGKYLNIDPIIIRIVFIIFTLIHGIGILIYIIMWIITPEEPISNLYSGMDVDFESDEKTSGFNFDATTSVPKNNSNARTVVGIILIILGVLFLADRYLPYFDFELLLPITLIIIGILLLINSTRKSNEN